MPVLTVLLEPCRKESANIGASLAKREVRSWTNNDNFIAWINVN